MFYPYSGDDIGTLGSIYLGKNFIWTIHVDWILCGKEFSFLTNVESHIENHRFNAIYYQKPTHSIIDISLWMCIYTLHLRLCLVHELSWSCIGCEQYFIMQRIWQSSFHCFTLLHYCLTISLKWSDQFDLKYNNIPKSCVIWPITHASFISRKHMLQLDGPGLVIPKKGKICRVSNCNRNIRFLDDEGQHCWAFLKVSLNQFKYNIVFKLVLEITLYQVNVPSWT